MWANRAFAECVVHDATVPLLFMKRLLVAAFGRSFRTVALFSLCTGLSLQAAVVTFIPAGGNNRAAIPAGSTNWQYRVGFNEASSPIPAWRSNSFALDGSWSTGALPMGYGNPANDANGYEAAVVTTLPLPSANNYLGVFVRKTFVVSNAAAFSSVTLSLVLDDGAVAWINGHEISRYNCCVSSDFGAADPSVPTFNAGANGAPADSLSYSTMIDNGPSGPLVEGTNVLAIQFFNNNLTSSDLVLDASLTGVFDDVAPVVVGQAPLANSTVASLAAVQVNFSETVINVEAEDLLINGTPAASVLSVSPSIYTFDFPQPPTGAVSVAFAPAHGITDSAGNPFAGASWTYNLDTNAVPSSFYISEFLASNNGNGTNALRDEDGDASDWIEIYNPDGIVGDIGGWYLTDTTNNLTKWRIPDGTTIGANSYLIVFASGKNRTDAAGKLHANFSLATSPGEYLALVNPNTNVVSEFYPAYPSQIQNVSYGRDLGTPTLVGYFAVPTPGADNTQGSNPDLDVQFSRTGGTFNGSFNLSLSTSDTNAQIRYIIVNTADNAGTATNFPTQASTLYTGPIAINNSVQVRARAFPSSGNSFPGAPRTECYFQIASGLTNFVSELPIVIIHTLAAASLSGGAPALDNAVMIACMDNNTPSGYASIMDPPQMVKRAGINLRGSSTQGFPKQSFAVELWDEYNNDEEAEFAGLPQESDWVLYAPNGFDKVLMHNPLMHKFARDMGYYSSRTRFVEVFFRNGSGIIDGTTNATGTGMGSYWGVYVLEEKVKRDGNRLDLDVLQPEHTNAPAITGGYLIKLDRKDLNERTFPVGNIPATAPDAANGTYPAVSYQEPDGLEMVSLVRRAQSNYLYAYLNFMYQGLINATTRTNIASTNHYSNYLDIDATIDHHIVNVLTLNVDGYRLSGYMHKPRNGKLILGPVWDVDRGLGGSDAGTGVNGDLRPFNPRAWQAWDPLGAGDYGTDFFQGSTHPTWMGNLFSDVDFWQRWIDRYQTWRTTTLDSNYVASIVDDFGDEVRAAQVREQKRWGGNGNSDTSPRNGTRTAGLSAYTHTFNGTYQGELDFQKRWLTDRIHFMDTNLLNRPTFDVEEGQVPLGTVVALADNSGKAGTAIYYTLDGSDPRGFQGRTNPAALLYNGPITITNNVRIHMRAVNHFHRNLTGTSGPGSRNPVVSSPWSGNIAATYYVTTPPLVISEIMFNPLPSSTPGDTNDSDNFEFVELMNIGTNTLNLVGFRFTNGIDFTFTATNNVTSLAPGGRVLIVKHLAAFTSRYGANPNVAGVYAGSLNNAGERLVLVGPRLEPILDFSYSDDWYPLADGLGFSLVIRDPYGPLDDWGRQASWRNSSLENGSPAAEDPAPLVVEPILINEALPHTDPPQVDAIEVYNPGTNDVNIGGWYLTDDPGEPKKFQIAANTIVPAGGYVVFFENEFGNAFSLSSNGDDLYVFSATNGVLTGFAHGFDFGATQNGLTLGRYVNSQGNEDFVAQIANSLGVVNTGPRVGPIIVSEIMYRPPDLRVGTNDVDNDIDEFIEIHNISASPVQLYHASHPSNTWRFTQAVDFNFPQNVTLAPNSFALVVNFNPVSEPAQLAAFRAKYGISPAVPIYGPYGGQLNNNNDNVRLSRPDDPNTDGTVPYILVDRVEYRDSGAWSEAADGVGASLNRIVPADYGNDPTNWLAAAPTPGGAFVPGTPPSIIGQPQAATVFVAGSTIDSQQYVTGATNFTVEASGSGLKYQWRFNGASILGATNATLVLTNIQTVQAGLYSVVVLNNGGAVISSNAQLTVITPIYFVTEPVFQSIQPGSNVTLTASAVGVGGVSYQWRFEGQNIPGATNDSYSITNADLNTHHGNYSVAATDIYGTVISSNAFVYVRVNPGIVQHLVSQTVLQGGSLTFSVIATGAPPLGYRWVRDFGQLPPIFTSEPTLTLTDIQKSGNIRVVVTNFASFGGVQSPQGPPALITMLADFDQDGVADVWESAYFGAASTNNPNNALEDPDGDTMINRDEYLAGTNPTNALSLLKVVFSATNENVITFVAQTNKTYSVQVGTNLSVAPVWMNLSNVTSSPQVRTIQVNTATAPGDSERYFRIVTPLVP